MVSNEIGSVTLFRSVGRVIEVNGPAFDLRKVRWSKSPITLRSSGDDVQVEMRNLLAATDAVVLIQEYSVWIKGVDQSTRGTLRRRNHGSPFVDAQIEQRGYMPPRDDDALSDLVLTSVQHRHRQRMLFDDGPLFRVTAEYSTEVTVSVSRQQERHWQRDSNYIRTFESC